MRRWWTRLVYSLPAVVRCSVPVQGTESHSTQQQQPTPPGGLSVKLKFGTVFNERKLVGELGTPIQAGDALVWRTLADGVLKIELRREGARWSCVEVKGWTRDPEQDMPTVKVRGEWSFLLTNP
eukprot:Hpha_TRINITY_DN14690_c0_g2::TRINITY_DN14690_c0_g2_i2::g.48188::m.48188